MNQPTIELHTLDGEVLDPRRPGTPLSFPLDYEPTAVGLIGRMTDRFGDLECIVDEDGRHTFRDIAEASRRLARHLVGRGVGKAGRVGMLLPQGATWVTTFLAAARTGALALPLSTFYTPSELATTLRHGDIEHLVVPARLFGRDMVEFLLEAVPGLADVDTGQAFVAEAPHLRSVTVVGTGPEPRPWLDVVDPTTWTDAGGEPVGAGVADEVLDAIEQEVFPADLLMIIHTSGTTSRPKGVVHTHGSQIRHGANLAGGREWSTATRVFVAMPFFWIGGLTHTLLAALHSGATMFTQARFDAGEALDLIERERPTHMQSWPNLRQRLVDHPSFGERDLTGIPFLPSPGDPPIDIRRFHNSLGMTETGGPHTAARTAAEWVTPLPDHHRGSFGPRMPYVQHRIVDPTTNETLPDGVEGEVCIRGYSVMAGMCKQEREEVFDADGWYHTGDRGWFRDGLLFFSGRYGEMIKTGGSNVAPREVEAALSGLDGVKAALVFGLPDAERGEVVVAGVVSEPGAELSPEQIRTAVRDRVSVYKVPRHVVVLDDHEVVYLGSGKPDRLAIRDLIAERLGSTDGAGRP